MTRQRDAQSYLTQSRSHIQGVSETGLRPWARPRAPLCHWDTVASYPPPPSPITPLAAPQPGKGKSCHLQPPCPWCPEKGGLLCLHFLGQHFARFQLMLPRAQLSRETDAALSLGGSGQEISWS